MIESGLDRTVRLERKWVFEHTVRPLAQFYLKIDSSRSNEVREESEEGTGDTNSRHSINMRGGPPPIVYFALDPLDFLLAIP